MEIIKTDSLGLEILNNIAKDEIGKQIKPTKNKDDAIIKNNDDYILFEMYEQNKIVGYFTLDKNLYNKWVIEYKIEGVEL